MNIEIFYVVLNSKRSSKNAAPFLFSLFRKILEYDDVLSLQALGAFSNCELYALSFFQIAVTITNDGIEMDEDVFALCTGNETVAFATIEPLYRTLFFFRHDLELLSCIVLP